jgi:hypothetical protein
MLQKCSIENINSSMHYFGLIILAIIVCIVFIYYIKITNAEHQEIIERYSENKIEAPYLKTGDLANSQEQVHNNDAKLIDTKFPTLNSLATSTATLRPCQIHFNKDETNKYIYEDGWKELGEIKTDENTIYKVPYKIFGNNFNNDSKFINFTETSTCFKVKDDGKGKVNTYKYKSNDLIKYNLNSYVKIKETGGVENEYMQMNFVKQDVNSADNYRSKAIDSICSYRYNPDLNLQNLKLYRFKINNTTDNNVEEINKISIEDKNNNDVTVEKSLDYSVLLGDNESSYDFDSSGKITYTVKEFKGDYFIPVKIYKFNRNLLCNDEIKSYEIHNKQINTGLLIESLSLTETIHNTNILAVANISDADKAEIIRLENLLNFNDFKGNIEEYANSKLSNTYKLKEQLLTAMLHNTYKLIAKANIDIAKKYSEELNKNKEREIEANSFIDSINTIDKLIKTYLDIPKPSQLPILEKIIGTTERKLFYKNCAGIMDYKEQNIIPDTSTSMMDNIEVVADVKKAISNGENTEIVFNYNEDTLRKYEIMVKKSTFVTLDDTKQLELSEGPYTIIKNTAYKKGFIMIKKQDAKSTVTNIIHSNSLNQIKISYIISAKEEYLNKITDNKDINLDSRAIIKSTVVDNSIMLNIGSKASNYKKINIYLSYLTSSVDILNVIQNIKIEYSVQGSNKRQLLNRDANYTIFNIITDSSVSFQKTTSFDIVFKSIINMDKIYMFLPKNKFYFLNTGSFPQVIDGGYSKYLSDKVNEIELKNDIAKLFEIDKTMKNLNDLKTNRIYAITNENYKMEVKNNSDSNNSIALLQDVYNKVLDYDTKNKKVTNVFKKTDIVKVFGDKSGESISDIKSKYISYESPNPRIALSVDEKYNIDKVSDNYIYFTIN